ncbi:MAG: FHA domain-containing protein [Rhodocyclales bacterium]|jgi:pSer/pThr/pTyr-binding forkhead associated (FHA) protein|nr:FHA domain-containing protein [Rhodocyclales bacterium]
MAKMILSVEGVTVKEIPLARERTTIGRKPNNDIRIDNLAISGEHAAIITMLNDSFLEDLDSTNGTYVNGRPVKKHFLQDGDVIELAKYRLKYVKEANENAGADTEKTTVLRQEAVRHALEQPMDAAPVTPVAAVEPQPPMTASAKLRGQLPVASIQVLSGNNAGREVDLTKTLTTLGKPGVMVAAIARRPLGYFITHVEGPQPPIVGGRLLEANKPYALMDHDIIELGGVKMEFFLKA